LYFDNSFIPGYCVLPKVFGLCSQAAALEEKLAANSAAPKEKRAAKWLAGMTRQFKSYCHFCGKSPGGGEKLPHCSKCKISYYCGSTGNSGISQIV
jgi:hypothetical protein